MRPLTDDQRRIVLTIVSALPITQRGLLLSDIARSLVRDVLNDGTRLEFVVDGYERPAYRGQHPVAVEGSMVDGDGERLDVLLHTDSNQRVLELELVRYADGPVVKPDWSTFSLI